MGIYIPIVTNILIFKTKRYSKLRSLKTDDNNLINTS
jgi:hypothetical protein